MATAKEIAAVAEALNGIPDAVSLCEQVALALIETGQPWAEEPHWFAWRSTDFERARDQVLGNLANVKALLRRIRGTDLSPDAIRTSALVAGAERACRECVKTNCDGLGVGKVFVCLAKGAINQHLPKFRFRLDGKGNIVGSR